MANHRSTTCWDIVRGNPEAQEYLRMWIEMDPLCEDWCELAERALALADG